MIALALPDGDGSFDPRRFLPLSDFLRQQQAPAVLKLMGAEPSAANARHAWTAIGHLQRSLGRPPLVADLTSESIDRLPGWLIERGRRRSTVNRVAQELIRLGKRASAEGLLDVAPVFYKLATDCRGPLPLTIGQLERLLAVAQERKGDIAGIPASHWWPAFCSQ